MTSFPAGARRCQRASEGRTWKRRNAPEGKASGEWRAETAGPLPFPRRSSLTGKLSPIKYFGRQSWEEIPIESAFRVRRTLNEKGNVKRWCARRADKIYKLKKVIPRLRFCVREEHESFRVEQLPRASVFGSVHKGATWPPARRLLFVERRVMCVRSRASSPLVPLWHTTRRRRRRRRPRARRGRRMNMRSRWMRRRTQIEEASATLSPRARAASTANRIPRFSTPRARARRARLDPANASAR